MQKQILSLQLGIQHLNLQYTLLVLFICLFGWLCISHIGYAEQIQTEIASNESVDKSRQDADTVIKSADAIEIRRNIKKLFHLVDKLMESGLEDEAFKYLETALQHNPWALNYQMIYAIMLEKRGERKKADEKAQMVLQYAENDELIKKASQLLKQKTLPSIPGIRKIKGNNFTIVIVPVGKVDIGVILDLKNALKETLPTNVTIQDAEIMVPPFKRDPMRLFLNDLRMRLLSAMDQDQRLVEFISSIGVSKKELEDDTHLIDTYRIILEQSENKKLSADFDTQLEMIRRTDKQWDIVELLQSLRSNVHQYHRKGVYYLGVTNLDTFADQNNFLFGTAENNGTNSLISYRRFTADFNVETPNRKRLVERALKQSLSSIGFMIGVKRCTEPTCARAYPHSLQEHDAKSTKLCNACAKGFERFFGAKLLH
jgi:predicted Zn-dependent protease